MQRSATTDRTLVKRLGQRFALLVWGERDTLVPPAVGDLMREEIPGSRLLVLERAAHVPMFDRPKEFNAALLSFLAAEPDGD